MNVQISELVEQCETRYIDRYGRICVEFDKDKFVVALVEECSNALNNNYPPDDVLPIEEVMYCLKKHFGVK